MAKGTLLVWFGCVLMFETAAYPDLSSDYSVAEADLPPLYRSYIDEQREWANGMPRVCRKGE